MAVPAMDQDTAAAKITAGIKGLHVRNEMKRGNSERFVDPEHDSKVQRKQSGKTTKKLRQRARPSRVLTERGQGHRVPSGLASCSWLGSRLTSYGLVQILVLWYTALARKMRLLQSSKLG